MTIVAARRYRQGLLVEEDLTVPGCAPCAELPSEDAQAQEFEWIGLVDPTTEEMAWVQQRYRLHPLSVEDALGPRQAPKVEPYGDHLFVIATTAALGAGDSIRYGQTAIFLGKQFIITVRSGSEYSHTVLRQHLEANPLRLREGPDFVLYAMLDFIVRSQEPLLDALENLVNEMEDKAIGSFPSQRRIRRIFTLRRLFRHYELNASRMEEIASKLADTELPAIDLKARPYFRDIYDDAKRIATQVRWLNGTLASIVEVAGLLENTRQGAVTRQLAAWAAILAVPTAIAGIYGMNFTNMPELEWRYGYFIVLGVLASLCGLLYWNFKRIGWL